MTYEEPAHRPVSEYAAYQCEDGCRCKVGHNIHVPALLVFDWSKREYIHADRHCTAIWKSAGDDHFAGQICGRGGEHRAGDTWFCQHHYERLFKWYEEQRLIEERAAAELKARWHAQEQEKERARAAEMQTWAAQGSQIVYYLLRGDGAIKIGTSINFPIRLGTLKREHGPLEILLTHCGDHPREHRIHGIFDELALGNEWFRAEEPLLKWIVQARRKRVNIRTRFDGTVPLRRVAAMLEALTDPEQTAA